MNGIKRNQMRLPLTEEEKHELIERLQPPKLKKLERMHSLHGLGPTDKRCGDCAHFFAAGAYYKCELYGITGGPGTDWRVRWQACGKFEER